MNRIYSNIKKTALSLLVVGLAISTQAYKSAESKSNLVPSYYGLNAAGTHYDYYGTTNPSGDCAFESQYPICTLEYTDGLVDTDGFDVGAKPGSPNSLGGTGFIN